MLVGPLRSGAIGCDRARFPSPSWPGEVPAIDVAVAERGVAGSRPTSERTCWVHSCRTTWMAGTSPAMTGKKPICDCPALRGRVEGDGSADADHRESRERALVR